ncbi:MAG: bifunctional (p)ppGpp synthetase/guanosine-3',5'-bis(diphosphate) 3'-pyrophosphohydrolase [Chitinophagales bacterium]|nr:bifunctional (p)ppGpp synthetase/guanosine-3',5'-bis(diphosphate) 3'-pyrophosphohydrolase [Chitinophagales bacterium]
MGVTQLINAELERKQILKAYRSMLRAIKPQMGKGDKENIRLAFEMAMDAHKDMRRKSGEPYILHPIAVAQIVAGEIGLDVTSVICALLHDVVEDTELTLEDIERSFNKPTAKIIDGLTKISSVFTLTNSIQAENFRKLLLTLTDDIRVILIKMADRLHNMRTLEAMPRQKQLKIASETSFLYAPLAHRMGLYAIKTELEDLSMKFMEADKYKSIATKLNQTKRDRNRFINEFVKPLKVILEQKKINYEILGRPKSIFSIWNKMKKKNVEFEQVYDLFAIRIIVDVEKDQEKSVCWDVYSSVTDVYIPNSNRLRDWVSNPKANGYEALHTTVMGPNGRWVEVQIRSRRMHEIAERGVAAHWKYKDDTESEESALDHWLQRIQAILNSPDSNALDFLNDVKLDLFSDEVFCFTPKGDLRRLRKGATALDFAFEIHSEIGQKCIGAKVNHKLVPLSYELENGDQIEILTSNKQRPNDDWLNYVVTAKARTSIKQSLKEEKRKVAEDGRAMVQRKFKQLKVEYNVSNINALVNYYKVDNQLELFYRIAKKQISTSEFKEFEIIGNKIRTPKAESPMSKTELTDRQVGNQLRKDAELQIMGEMGDTIDYKFANCCNPIPGDDVFGFITINEGVKIHRTNCPNASQMMSKYGYRVVETKWNYEHEIAFLTGLKINGLDDVGVINKITNIISGQLKVNMRSMSLDSKDGIFEGDIFVYVNDTSQLDDLIEKLKALDGVLSVNRIE